MSSLWKDLLCLHGYITDQNLARRWANPIAASPTDTIDKPRDAKAPTTRPLRWYARLCLGIGDGTVHVQ